MICYAERVHDMHDIAKYLHPPLTKVDIFELASWDVRNKELSENEICVSIKTYSPNTCRMSWRIIKKNFVP